MAGNVVSNLKKYYGGQVPVPSQGDSDGKVKVLVEKTATIEIGGVQTEVELLFDSDDMTTPVTPQQFGQWTDENYLIAFKKREDDGRVRGFVLYALETDSTSTDTLVNRAEFIAFKEDMTGDPGASAYEFTMVEDSSTLARYLRDENGEMVVKFNQATVEAGAQSGTLHELIDTDTTALYFEVVHEDGKSYLRLNTESLSGILDDMDADIKYIIGALDELPSDDHGYFNSSLYTTPGDGTTTNLVMDDFRIMQDRDVSGENIEFVPTHQEGGVDFGNVYLEPGTYILAIQYTLQWVGNPRGTFLPKVCSVADQPFDFSYEHEDVIRVTRIVTRTTRGKLVTNIPIDADTPQIGIWAKNLEIAQIASYNHAAVAHDTTLTGTGKLDSPLGVTTDTFGKVKDIPTSISQFRTGDVIPVDGPNGPAKIPTSDLQDAILGGPIDEAVQAWLDEHPEATTTVQDESITLQKLNSGLASTLAFAVSNLVALRDFRNASSFNGKLISTKGYYAEGDGGGAHYLIVEGTASDDGFLSIAINGGTHYAKLVSIDILGYIDPRWAGAVTDGTTDTSAVLQKCIDESNRRHLTPIKIVGAYYIGATVNVIGDLCIFGETRPAPFLIGHPNNPNVVDSNPSKIIIATGVTAFYCIGMGGTSATSTRRTNLWIKNIEAVGETSLSGTFIYTDAFGAPSRPSKICECYIHSLDKFFVCKHTAATASNSGTSLYTFDIGNNYIASVNLVFDVTSENSRSTLGGLNIHDNTIEWCNGITLNGLFGCNYVTNNLFEGCTGDFVLSLTRGTIDFSGNYFENNNHDIRFGSDTGPLVSSVRISSIYVNNSALKFRFYNVLTNLYKDFTSVAQISIDLCFVDEILFLNGIAASAIGANYSLFRISALQEATSDDRIIDVNGSIVYRGNNYKEVSAYLMYGYSSDFHYDLGDTVALIFTSLNTANVALTYIDSTGSSSGYGLAGKTLYLSRGINVFLWKPQKTTATTSGAFIFTPTGTPYCKISNIVVKKLDLNTPILRQLSTVTPGFV